MEPRRTRNVFVPATVTRPPAPPVILDAEPIPRAPSFPPFHPETRPPVPSTSCHPGEPPSSPAVTRQLSLSDWFCIAFLVSGGFGLALVGLSSFIKSRLFLWPLMLSFFGSVVSLAGLMISRWMEFAVKLLMENETVRELMTRRPRLH